MWNLADNLPKGLHKATCEKCKSGLEYSVVKYNTIQIQYIQESQLQQIMWK